MLHELIGIHADPTFAHLSANGLVWLPEHGIGYLPVTEAPYDADYFAKYEGYAATEKGRAITKARADLVERHASRRDSVVDVGIGCGDFLVEMKRRGWLEAYGSDINPAGLTWLQEREWFLNTFVTPVDAVTFWDAIEHIPNAAELLANVRQWVFCSLPIVPGAGPPSLTWKHLRRDEHCWYFTRAGFISWMAAQGFECVEQCSPESLLGREDIETFAFRRVQA